MFLDEWPHPCTKKKNNKWEGNKKKQPAKPKRYRCIEEALVLHNIKLIFFGRRKKECLLCQFRLLPIPYFRTVCAPDHLVKNFPVKDQAGKQMNSRAGRIQYNPQGVLPRVAYLKECGNH